MSGSGWGPGGPGYGGPPPRPFGGPPPGHRPPAPPPVPPPHGGRPPGGRPRGPFSGPPPSPPGAHPPGPPGGPPHRPFGPGGPPGPPPPRGPGYGGGHGGGFGPPPRKRSALLPILLCSGGAFLFLIFLVVVFAALLGGGGGSSSSSPSTYTGYTPTSTYSYSSYSPTYTYTTSTGLPTSSESSTGTDGGGAYGSPEDNKVYATGSLAGVGCTARLRSTAPGPYEDYVEDVIPCLNEAWKAQLAKQGIAFQEPGVVVSTGNNPSSPCSSANTGYTPAAFYCPTNQTMYFNLPAAKGAPVGFAVRTAAHEYGHHVQELTGVLEVMNQRYQENYADISERSRLTRRNELQAQCFAAMFLGGNAGSMGTSQQQVVKNTGADDYVEGVEDDPSLRTHGNLRNNRYWLRQGWPTGSSACNTWTAPPTRVA